MFTMLKVIDRAQSCEMESNENQKDINTVNFNSKPINKGRNLIIYIVNISNNNNLPL